MDAAAGRCAVSAFGNKRPSRRLRSKMQAVEQAHRADRAQQPGQTAGLCDENRGVSRYLTHYGCYPAMAEHHRPVFLLR